MAHILVFATMLFTYLIATPNPKDVAGKWISLTEDEGYIGHYNIFEYKDKFYGKLTYYKGDDGEYHIDENEQPLMLKDFTAESDKILSGTFYDPEEDKEYKAKIEIVYKNYIKVRIQDEEGEYAIQLLRIIK